MKKFKNEVPSTSTKKVKNGVEIGNNTSVEQLQKELEELNERDQKVWGWIGAKKWWETKWEHKKELLAPYLLPHLYIEKRKTDILQKMGAPVKECIEVAEDIINFIDATLLPLGEYLQKVEGGVELMEGEDKLAWVERAKDHLLEEMRALEERGEGGIKDAKDFKNFMYLTLREMWMEYHSMLMHLKRNDKKNAEFHEQAMVYFLDNLTQIGKKFYEMKFEKINKYE